VAKLQEQITGWNWSLSPNGTSIAAVTFSDNRIWLLSLSGQPTREFVVKNWNGFTTVDWAADSKGLFVASNPTGWRSTLLYVDLAGTSTPTLASEEHYACLGHSLAQWKIPGHSRTHRRQQCLDG
jgi:Tol biopolymer transport system component